MDYADLGPAMGEAAARDGLKNQGARITKLEHDVMELRDALQRSELELSKCMDACRFLYRWYVDNKEHGVWPLGED